MSLDDLLRPRGEDLVVSSGNSSRIRNLERLRDTLRSAATQIERDRVALHALERDRAAMLRLVGQYDYSVEYDRMRGAARD